MDKHLENLARRLAQGDRADRLSARSPYIIIELHIKTSLNFLASSYLCARQLFTVLTFASTAI